jgi:hypothetical protein
MPFKEIMRRWQDRMEAAFQAFYTISRDSGEPDAFVVQAADQVAYIRELFRKMPAISDSTGTVSAGDLAQWREGMKQILAKGSGSIEALAQLAAMPRPDMNTELLDHLNTCAGLLGDDYDLLDSKDDSHMAVRVKRVQEALVDARAAIAQAEKGAPQ